MSSSSLHGVKSPAISHPLDFDDQAAHRARNGQVAIEPWPTAGKNLMWFQTQYYQVMQSSSVCSGCWVMHLIFFVKVQFVCRLLFKFLTEQSRTDNESDYCWKIVLKPLVFLCTSLSKYILIKLLSEVKWAIRTFIYVVYYFIFYFFCFC